MAKTLKKIINNMINKAKYIRYESSGYTQVVNNPTRASGVTHAHVMLKSA